MVITNAWARCAVNAKGPRRAGARPIGCRLAACAAVLAVMAAAIASPTALPAAPLPDAGHSAYSLALPTPHPAPHSWPVHGGGGAPDVALPGTPPYARAAPNVHGGGGAPDVALLPPLAAFQPTLFLPAAYADHMRACDSSNLFFTGRTSIEFLSSDGTYKLDDVIQIRVNASNNISSNAQRDVDHSSILLNTGRHAAYSNAEFIATERTCYDGRFNIVNCGDPAAHDPYEDSRMVINRLVYNYTVQAGDSAADLDYDSTTSLYWHNGRAHFVANFDGDQIDCRLPAPGASGSLSHAGAVAVDGIVPVAQTVRSDAMDGTLRTGTPIGITVTFNEPVVVTGEPRIELETGATDGYAAYSSGSGTGMLEFVYTVAGAHVADDLDYKGSLDLNGGTITDVPGNAANLTLPAPGSPGSLGGSGDLRIEVTAESPVVSNVTSTDSDGSYNEDDTINILINFSSAVDVSGTPVLGLSTVPPQNASYASGSGNATLVFTYNIEDGDSSDRLAYAGRDALRLGDDDDITAADNARVGALLALPPPGSPGSLGALKNIVIDTADPAVDMVYSTDGNASYKAGDTVRIAVGLDEAVTVSTGGTPRIELEMDGGNRHADYTATSADGMTLNFEYAVVQGDNAGPPLAYAGTAALDPRGATIVDAAGNGANLTLPAPGGPGSLSHHSRVAVDTDAPRVADVYAPDGNASYRVGGTVPIAVEFTEPVLVPAGPQDLPQLELGTTPARPALYHSGNGTHTLVFAYTVRGGDNIEQLVYSGENSLGLPGMAFIRDAAGNDANRTLYTPSDPESTYGLWNDTIVTLDNTRPSALSASSPNPAGTYGPGEEIAIEVEFDEAVYVRGAPTLELSTGGSAAYDSGNGTATLTFLYTVRQADGSGVLDYAAGTGTLATAGAADSIRDKAGNDADDSMLPTPGHQDSLAPQALYIDATGPSVVSVYSPTYDGPYGPGAAIWIDVEFDERVYVVGGAGPTLELNVPMSAAAYHSGNGTDTLRLLYTVGAGHNVARLDYADANALEAAGGAAVRDYLGNDADLTLEDPGDAGSLSNSSSITIDTATPACPSADDRCVYHVTRSLAVGDIITHAVRVDPDTGYVYTASQPGAGSMDINYSYVRIYSSAEEGHELIREIRFNGTNSRVPEIEINTETDELHVINMWGVGDTEHGWAGIDEYADGNPTNWDGTLANLSRICNIGNNAPPACFDGRGKANLTTISLDTHTVTATVQLEHDETDGNGNTTVQRYAHLGSDYDLVLDTARDIAYISDRNAPILAVNTSDTTLMRALVNHSAALGGGGTGSAWNAYLEGASATAMAVDEATGTVYAAVRTGPAHDRSNQAWGVAALSFLDVDGAFTPHYTRTSLAATQSNPASSSLAGCRHADFNDFDCGRHVRSYSMQLDAADSKLFVLFANHTVWAYGLGGSGELSAAAAPPEEVHVRTPAEAGRIGDRPVLDIVLDGERRLLYASLYDYTDPRVVSISADDHTRVGVSSGTSQLRGMGLDRQSGALYVLPEWAPHAYVIEAELRPSLQSTIDGAADYSTVRVPAGTYDDTVLDIARPLTLVSDPPGAAKFTGYSRIEVESDDVVVGGLAFEDTDCLPGFGGSLVEIRAHHGEARENVSIEDNTFRNTCHAAIQKEGTGGLLDVSIRNNTFEGIGLRLPDGWTEPVDTGGENEFQIMHAAIGLAHHPGQGTVGGSITDNRIVGTSAAGIRVFKADGLVISGNYIEDTPASGIGLAHSPRNVLVANNTIVDANNEPDLDYLAGVDGSGDAEYYKTIYRRVNYLTMSVLDAPYHTPAPDAAISVWSNGMNITATGNTIRESDGAFAVCAGVCAFESDGVVRADNRNIPDDKDITNAGYSFTGNTVHWHVGPDNNGVLVRSGAAAGALNATGNYFAGLGAMPDRSVISDGMVDLGEMLLPSVASVSTDLYGAYGPGTPVYIDIEFTEAVYVQGGPPTLALATTPPRDAVYHTGSGSATLTFLYTVRDGDAADDLNYRDAEALALNDGTIRTAAGRDAGLGLPGTDSALSLGGYASIVPASSTAVRVTGVSSTNQTGTYTGGSVIEIEVAFDAAVNVAAGDGGTATPALALDLDPPGYATYAGGSGSATLEFLYTVQPGDGSEALDYADRAALLLNGSAIRAVSDGSSDAVLTLPEEGSAGSLADSGIRVSGAHAVAAGEQPLRLDDMSATAASIAVDPSGRTLVSTAAGRVQAYDPDGTKVLDESPGGMPRHIASDPSGRIIVANSTTVSVLHRNGTLAFQISGPAGVIGVASDPSGRIIVANSTTVSVLHRNGTLALEIAGLAGVSGVASDPSGRILASAGSGHKIDVFHPNGTGAYAIGADRFAGGGDLDAMPGALSHDPSGRLLVAVDGGAVHALRPDGGSSVEFRMPYPHDGPVSDIASDPSGRILVAGGRPGVVDMYRLEVPLAPAVEDVSARAGSHDGSLAAGEPVVIDVLFDSDVSVNTTGGSPTLLLETGAPGRHAAYAGSSGRTVSFTYTPALGDESADLGYAWAGALDPRGAAITDDESGLLTASTALPPPGDPGSLSDNEEIDVDTAAPSAVSARSPNATDKVYTEGDRITVEVRFDDAVFVAGRPFLGLGLDGNGATGRALYDSGSDSATLTFVYEVLDGHNAASLDYTGTEALDLDGGSITDAAGNDAVLTTLPDPGNDGLNNDDSMPIAIDALKPTVSSVLPLNMTGMYTVGARIAINVTFTEAVAVTGTPQLALETGDTDRPANYTAGNNSQTLTFLYTVREGDNSADLDYANETALTFNGGSITDAAGNDARLTLQDPGTDGLLDGDDPIKIDTMGAIVERVTSDRPDGAYNAFTIINIQVVFSEPVVVTGRPALALEIEDTVRQLDYNGGNESDTLTFPYYVLQGHNSDRLDYANASALTLNGGTIKDTSGNNATLTLPDPGDPNSLAGRKDIAVDTIDPRVLSVSSTSAAGHYMAGERIAINVTFSEPVIVTGAPTLWLIVGSGTGPSAHYVSGSGSANLTLVYTVLDGHNVANLNYRSENALQLGGRDAVRDAAGNDAVLTPPSPDSDGLIGPSMPIVIDTTAPEVRSVLSLNDTGHYMAGERIAVNVTFSEAVLVAGTPQLAMETGATDRQANYTAGSGSAMLTFVYTVQQGDTSADLDYANATALTLGDGDAGAIRDEAGNDADRTLQDPGTDGLLDGNDPIKIDTMGATVERVTSDYADGAYTVGRVIDVQVVFSEPVVVTGRPALAMNTGQTASYSAGSNSNTLVFTYPVMPGDNSSDLDYANDTALALNGGTIKDTSGNNATLTLPDPGGLGSLAYSKNIAIDTIDPRILSASSPNATGVYGIGDRIAINVTFNEPVVVAGTPYISLVLDMDPPDRRAWYDSGTNSTMLTFVYTVRANHNAEYLIYAGVGALHRNVGIIRDAAGNNADRVLPSAGVSLRDDSMPIRIDTTAPEVSGVSALNMTGMYTVGARIAVSVTFSEPVFVAGTPQLAMETGATDRQANYTAGSGSQMLAFVYTVQQGDTSADLDYANETALALNGGSIRDEAGNNATLTLLNPGDDGLLDGDDRIKIDTMGATVDRVTSDTADDAYMENEVIDVKVVFSETVVVTGTPVLAMETGETDQQALYNRGTNSDTLTFLYTVQPEDNSGDLDYANDTALALNGGTIKDTSNNDAMLMLPSPGSADSLAGLKDIVVDTIDPRAVSVSSLNETGAYMSGERIAVNVTFTEPVFVAGSPFLGLALDGNGATGQARYDSGNGSAMLTFVYTVQPGDDSANLDYTGTDALDLDGGTIRDRARNSANLTTLPDPGDDGLIGSSMPIRIDTTAPEVSGVSSLNGSNMYTVGARIAVSVTFDEPVLVKGTPQLAMETGATDRQANYTAGSGSAMLMFVYAVREGDNAANLDYTGTDALTLGDGGAGAITDEAGNNADLTTLPDPGDDGLIGTSMPIVIDTIVPTVSTVSSPNATDTYGTGKRIVISVAFNETVVVTGVPRLALETGDTDQQALYVAGSNSTTLTFVYQVLPNDNATYLDYTGTDALTLAGGSTITDKAGNSANLTLPAPGTPGSLAGTGSPIAIDGTGAGVLRVDSDTDDGAYMADEVIDIKVVFSENVTVGGTGMPTLALATGGAGQQAVYDQGSNSTTLTFLYTVQPGDNSADLDYAGRDALALGGSTIRDSLGNDAILTLQDPGHADRSLAGLKDIVVDTIDPRADSVSSLNETGAYMAGERIAVNVTFSEPVIVKGTPQLAMETGATDRQADYTAGNGSAMLTFVYVVQPGDTSAGLDYTGTDALTLGASAGGAIMDEAGNNATLTTLPDPGDDGLIGSSPPIAIDTTKPTVSTVSSPNATDTYGTGKRIAINVTFSERVVVKGTPMLAMETGDTDQQALYVAGSGSSALTFVYQVRPNDNATDLDYTGTNALTLAGGTASIKDAAGNNANRTLPEPGNDGLLDGANNTIAIDGTGAGVLRVTSDKPNGAYMAGVEIDVKVVFSENVTVGGAGAPTLALETGATDRQATYDSGSNSTTLTFLYTVQPGDNSVDLDYTTDTGALALNGSTIRDSLGNNATLALPLPGDPNSLAGSKNITVDTTDPWAVSASSLNATGAYMAYERIAVNVTFSEPVVVAGKPTLAMETGATDRQAEYTAGSGSAMLTFVYAVQPGDASENLDYTGTDALKLGDGGAIRDKAGNNATLALPDPGDDGLLAGPNPIRIDTMGASVLRVTSDTADGAYMADAIIDVKVEFSEAVTVGGTGTPTLAMETGETDRQALYDSGSGSETLTFLYTVQPGDNSTDLDYVSTTALALGGGSTIQDAGRNNATLTLPDPGDDGSLAGSKEIVIDTAAPAVSSVSSPNGTGTYGTGERIAVGVNFTEAVLVEGTPVLAMETGDTDRQALYDSGSNSAALTFVYTVQDGDSSENLDYANASALTLDGGTASIKDAAGNDANLTLREPGDDGLLDGPNPIRIDTGGAPVRGNATVLSAVFTARNAITITYSGSLDRPEGHEGPVYGSVFIAGGYNANIAPGNVTGLGTATHRISFGGAGVNSSQAGTISLASELVGSSSTGAVLRFADPSIPVERGETIRVVEQRDAPLPGAPPPPAVAIERDGFTRAVNATGAGNGTRVAINVTGLAPLPGAGGAPPAANATTTAEFPAEPIRLIAVFAEVTFPANATASSVPAGGLIVLYASEDVPPAVDIAAALGIADAGSLRVRQVVEIGDNATHIGFDAPVRILLVGQAGGSGAFYVNTTDGSVVPIDVRCDADDVVAVTTQLGGAGECWIDVPDAGASGAGGGKVIYTYHLTRFGTAEEAPAVDADPPEPASVSVLQRPGGAPLRAPASYVEGQTIIIAVDFSAPVSVDTAGGTPRILLDTGSAGAAALYDSGGGTDRLEFAYAVRGGDITGRLSYAGTGALELGGGSITAAGTTAATAASLVLPPPGNTGSLSAPNSPAVRIDPIGRPVLAVGILDEGGNAGAAGHISRAAYMAAAEFNERQGRTDGALLINATSYDAGGGGTAAGSAAADALRSAHSSGSGPSVYVGPSTDRGLHAAMPYAAANGIVLVSAGSTAPSLAVADDRTFRLLPNDRLEAEALARLAYSGGDELVHAVLDNATYGPAYGSGSNGGLADADIPPPQGAFAHAFGAALALAAISPLSGTVTLAGGGADAGAPYDAAAAAAALDASVQSAASGNRPASVVYLGSPEGLAALAEASAQYPALSSASWFASGLSAGSGLLAGDGSAAGFAASSGLSAVRWSPPSSAAGQAIDSMLPGLGPGERNSAYAAYDAMIVAGEAAVAAAAEIGTGSGDVPGTAAIADALPAAAAAYDGALGDIALDYAGDLWVPAVYDLWTVAAQGGGAGTTAEWSRQQGELDGERSCSITLTRSRIDYGPIDSGQTSRPHLQTIVNTGQLPFAQVDLTTTPWHVDSPGNCEPGVEPSLPVGLSEVRTEQGGAFSDLTGTGTVLAQGLEAGSRAPLWYRLSLAGYADLPQAEITQCATYVVRCS